MAPTPDSQSPPAKRATPALIGAGVLVIVLGFGLPRLTPDAIPDPKPGPSTPAAAKPAAEARPATAPVPVPGLTPGDGPGLGASLARLAGSLVLVCGLCVGVMKLTARRPTAPTPGMEVLASLSVDPRCAVYLVKTGDRRLLVGIDAGGVKALVELPGPPPEPVPEMPAVPVSSTVNVVVGPVVMPAPVEERVVATAPVAAAPAPAAFAPVAVPAGPPSVDEIASLIARLRKAS